MDSFTLDLTLAWRSLRRAPGFAVAAVLTLAVGIAGTTSMFALVNGVLLRPLPFADQDRLFVVSKGLSGADHWPFELAELETIRDESRLFRGVAGVHYDGALPLSIVENGVPGSLVAASVTGAFFDVLGAHPMFGRAIVPADDVAGAEHVLVITHALWQRRYGGSPDVVGRRVIIQRQPFTVVGVMPPDVAYPRGVEAWMTAASTTAIATNPAFRVSVELIARLRDGTTSQQAMSELRTLTAHIDAQMPPGRPRGLIPMARPIEEVLVGGTRPTMIVLFGAVSLVLLIASANVASLLLARGEARRVELAIRAACGAGRAQLVRQLLAESLLLALAAGAVAVLMAWWLLESAVALVPEGLPRVDGVRLDTTALLFALLVSFVTAALAGLVPAAAASRADVMAGLRGVAAAGGVRRARRALVVAQVALAVTVVAAAGLLGRSLLNLRMLGGELAVDRLVLVPLDLPQPAYADRDRHLQFLQDVIARLTGLPDVVSATAINATPFSGTGWDAVLTAEGQPAAEASGNPLVNLESIDAHYFSTFALPVLRGRPFTDRDRDDAPRVAIVSQDIARRLWPDADPIGRRLKLGAFESPDEWRTVVGVVPPTHYRALAEPRPTLYLPGEQFLVTAQSLVVRSAAPTSGIAALAREQVRAIDPGVQVMSVVPFTQLMERPLARPRFQALLVSLFGGSSLLLVAVGLYALMATLVRQRFREIGVRMALGATTADVRWLVVRDGLLLAAMGAAIGLAAAAATAPLLQSLLFDVHPLDVRTLAAAAVLLVAVCGLACWLPARAAARVSPLAILRLE